MNILFISNGIYEYDGRTRELIKVTEMLGEAVVVIRASDNVSNIREYKCFCNLREKSYPQFIIFCIKVALSCPQVDILFIDNRKAIIPGIIINLLKHPKYIAAIQYIPGVYLGLCLFNLQITLSFKLIF